MCMCVSTLGAYNIHRGQKKAVDALNLELWVAVCWEPNPHPLKEQTVVLPREPSLQLWLNLLNHAFNFLLSRAMPERLETTVFSAWKEGSQYSSTLWVNCILWISYLDQLTIEMTVTVKGKTGVTVIFSCASHFLLPCLPPLIFEGFNFQSY